jgi:glycosyltransferase involved in cell wall biosynthesis
MRRRRGDDQDADPGPLRIGMVVPPWYELPPRGYGGVEAVCSGLIDALVDRGHEVTLFGAGKRCGTKARLVSTTATPQFRRLGETLPDVLHRARVQRLLADGDFDIVHDHTTPGALLSGQLPWPTVVTVHGSVEGELGDYYAAIGPAVRLVAISHDQRRARPDLSWIATVHHGLSLPDHIDPSTGDGPVMWLARFNPEKGPEVAVSACRAAGLPLVLAGKCNEPAEHRYLAEVIEPMIGDDVELVVNPDRETAMRRLAAARCLILPITWREPFGMVMIEAMARGVPVVAARRGSTPEVVEHGVTGFLCDSPAELTHALHKVIELDRTACIDRVRRRFTVKIMAERYERVYRRAMNDSDGIRSRWRRLPGEPVAQPPSRPPIVLTMAP